MDYLCGTGRHDTVGNISVIKPIAPEEMQQYRFLSDAIINGIYYTLVKLTLIDCLIKIKRL